MSTHSNFDQDAVLSKDEKPSHVDDRTWRIFKLLIEQSDDLHFALTAAENRFFYINPVVKETLGYTVDEVMRLAPQAMMSAASMSELCDTLHRTVAESTSGGEVIIVKPQRLQLLAKDRRQVNVEMRLFVGMKPGHIIDTISGTVRIKAELVKTESQSQQGRILVMDDEEILLDLAKQMCRRVGYEAETVQNGNDAIERYLEAFLRGHPYAAVLLDMTIAGGMGGIETAAALRKIDPDVKIIVMSGYSDHEVMAEPEKYGFTAVMTKPFRLNELQKVLGNILPLEEFKSGENGTDLV